MKNYKITAEVVLALQQLGQTDCMNLYAAYPHLGEALQGSPTRDLSEEALGILNGHDTETLCAAFKWFFVSRGKNW